MASMIGEEVTSFTHGHFNTFPLTRATRRVPTAERSTTPAATAPPCG